MLLSSMIFSNETYVWPRPTFNTFLRLHELCHYGTVTTCSDKFSAFNCVRKIYFLCRQLRCVSSLTFIIMLVTTAFYKQSGIILSKFGIGGVESSGINVQDMKRFSQHVPNLIPAGLR